MSDKTNSYKITADEKLGRILKNEYLQDCKRFVLPMTGNFFFDTHFKNITIRKMAGRFKTWNPQSMVDGLNALIEHKKPGAQVFHNPWSSEERAADPSRNNTALFHFSVKEKRPYGLICPGGAYFTVASIVEGFPIAEQLNRMGYPAFILNYRCGKKNPFPKPVDDLKQSVRYITENAGELNVESSGYAVMGCSAGGHLAAEFGTDNYGYSTAGLPRPSALILSYPVINFDKEDFIRDIILGKRPAKSDIDGVNVALHIGEDYPPAYLWHCRDDDAVPFEHSETMTAVLEEKRIPHKFRIVGHGGHGLGLGTGTEAEGWLKEAVEFWKNIITTVN